METTRRLRPFRFRFSLRTFLLLCSSVAAVSGMVISYAATVGHTYHAVRSLERLGVVVGSDFYDRYGIYPPARKGTWTGLFEWSFASPLDVSVVSASPVNMAPITQHVTSLPTIQRLHITATEVSLANLEQFTRLPRLSELGLAATSVDDSAIQLLAKLPHLRTLDLSETEISDTGLREVAGFASLESITLNKTRVSNHGLRVLHRSRADLSVQPSSLHPRHRRGTRFRKAWLES